MSPPCRLCRHGDVAVVASYIRDTVLTASVNQVQYMYPLSYMYMYTYEYVL